MPASVPASPFPIKIYILDMPNENNDIQNIDLEREYGNEAKAEKMRAASEKNGWIPVSMKNDWKTIYGDSVQKAN